MSETNIEAVRESYETPGALSATWGGRMAPNIEFDFTAVYPDRPVMRGIEELRRFREEGPWAKLRFEPERFVDVDDERVLVLVRVYATGTGSGVPVELRNAHEFTVRDGVLVRFKVYGDRGDALEAAGLSE
jgi:uncharacterized protein